MVVSEIVKDAYEVYGRYVNWFRAIPGVDGLKPVQRRVLIGSREVARKFVKTATLSGHVMAKYHPHGDASINSVIVDLVQKGLLHGQGNFGAKLLEVLPPAAPRYTEVRYNESLEPLFKLVPYVPHFSNELDNDEPEYLPTPIPFALVYGTSGIGVGTACSIPPFTPESLLQAYEKDDPELLEANYGYILVKNDSDLKGIWESGTGQLRLRYVVRIENTPDGHVAVLEGRGQLFRPKVHKILPMVNEGKIFIRDESSDKVRLVIGKVYRKKGVTSDDLLQIAQSISSLTTTYTISIFDSESVRRIGIRDWLSLSRSKFMEATQNWKNHAIQVLEKRKKVLTNLPRVIELILKDKTDDQISSELGIEIEIVKEILSKPLSYLRKVNLDVELRDVNKELKYVRDWTPNPWEYVQMMGGKV